MRDELFLCLVLLTGCEEPIVDAGRVVGVDPRSESQCAGTVERIKYELTVDREDAYKALLTCRRVNDTVREKALVHYLGREKRARKKADEAINRSLRNVMHPDPELTDILRKKEREK